MQRYQKEELKTVQDIGADQPTINNRRSNDNNNINNVDCNNVDKEKANNNNNDEPHVTLAAVGDAESLCRINQDNPSNFADFNATNNNAGNEKNVLGNYQNINMVEVERVNLSGSNKETDHVMLADGFDPNSLAEMNQRNNELPYVGSASRNSDIESPNDNNNNNNQLRESIPGAVAIGRQGSTAFQRKGQLTMHPSLSLVTGQFIMPQATARTSSDVTFTNPSAVNNNPSNIHSGIVPTGVSNRERPKENVAILFCKKYKILIAIIAFVFAIGVVAGMLVSRKAKSNPSTPSTMSPTMAPTRERQKSLICPEHGFYFELTPETAKRYNELRQNDIISSFFSSADIGTGMTDVNNYLDCSPAHLALVWLVTTTTRTMSMNDDNNIVSNLLTTLLKQRYILAFLHIHWLGNGWDNSEGWLSDTLSECEWFGITCNTDQEITKLELTVNNLENNIPSQIGYLSMLELFDVYDNSLTGTVPTTIGKLTSLELLDFSLNGLVGHFPIEYLYINIESLSFATNRFDGSLPTEIGRLRRLERLHIGSNRMDGSIPSEIGLTRLVEINAFLNSFAGTIPDEFWDLTLLSSIDLSGNLLGGTIPSTVGNLNFLAYFDLFQNNGFYGTIPTEIGNLRNIELMNLAGNDFSGVVPSEIGSCSNLVDLYIGKSHDISGTIPTEFGMLSSLETLEISHCSLTGPIPTEIFALPKLVKVNLDDNQLTGSLPSHFLNVDTLECLVIDNNQLSAIPLDICPNKSDTLETIIIDCGGRYNFEQSCDCCKCIPRGNLPCSIFDLQE